MPDAQRDYGDWIFDNAHRIEEFNAMTRDAFAALVWDAARAGLAASPSEEVIKAADRLAGVAQAHADDYLTSTLQECIDAYPALRTTKEGEGHD